MFLCPKTEKLSHPKKEGSIKESVLNLQPGDIRREAIRQTEQHVKTASYIPQPGAFEIITMDPKK